MEALTTKLGSLMSRVLADSRCFWFDLAQPLSSSKSLCEGSGRHGFHARLVSLRRPSQGMDLIKWRQLIGGANSFSEGVLIPELIVKQGAFNLPRWPQQRDTFSRDLQKGTISLTVFPLHMRLFSRERGDYIVQLLSRCGS